MSSVILDVLKFIGGVGAVFLTVTALFCLVGPAVFMLDILFICIYLFA